MLKVTVFLFLTISFIACSSAPVSKKPVRLKHEALISSPGSKKVKIKSGGGFYLSSAPILVEGKNQIPIYLVPVDKKRSSTLEIELENYDSAMTKGLYKEMDTVLFTVLQKIESIRQDISKDNVTEAISKAKDLKAEFPFLNSVDFILASIYVSKGNKSEAISYLEKGLSKFPNYKDGQELYQKISGKKWVEREIASEGDK